MPKFRFSDHRVSSIQNQAEADTPMATITLETGAERAGEVTLNEAGL